MEQRELTCIGCPIGCRITVTIDGGTVTTITGNTCPRGASYAAKEVTNPTRIVTGNIRVAGGTLPVVSYKTSCDIPKEHIFDVVDAAKNVTAAAPVAIGDILLKDAAGCGADLVATKNVSGNLSNL